MTPRARGEAHIVRALPLVLALTACTGGSRTTPERPGAERLGTDRPAGATAEIRFLALGDSYTIGERVEPAGRWPVQLAVLLRGSGVPVAEPEIVARTGWTTDELAAGIDSAAPIGPFSLVTLLIGVNDQYRGRDTAAYRPAFRAMVARAVGFAGGDARRVVVLSIPDWGVTPFASRDRAKIAAEIDRYNAVNRDESLRAGAAYVDVTPESREAATNLALVAGDGLHPSAAMYAAWARLALPNARAALGRAPIRGAYRLLIPPALFMFASS